MSVSAALLGDFHRVRPRLGTATFEEVRGRYLFNGVGGELRYRFLDRRHAPFGLTLHLEPSVARSDDVSGLRGRKFATENKVIIDRELVRETVFAALNLLQELEWMRGNAREIERGAKIGASLALAFRVHPQVFVGVEARYLRAYDGLGLKSYLGDAIHVGPSVSAKINDKFWINLAYGGLVGGREKGSDQRFDLTHFAKHQVRLKVGYEF